MTKPIDPAELFNQISPENYRVFRRLYNQLLGYLERDEFDKIAEFSAAIEGQLANAYSAQVALVRRIKNAQKDSDILKKVMLQQRFRNPKTTMPITHPFPLPTPVQGAPKQDPIVEKVGAASTLAHDREVDELMTDMAAYNKTAEAVDAQADDMTMPLSTVDAGLSDAAPGEAATQLLDSSSPDAVAEDGGKRTDDLEDGTLYFTQSDAEDLARSESAASDEQVVEDVKKRSASKPQRDDAGRKSRIWDYIKDDQSSGGIDHDL
ncbi:MAG: hypothetical protein ACON35_04235 [Candidatus Marinamargulisbacteria bacterium]